MSIEKLTIQESLKMQDFSAVYKRTAAVETKNIDKHSLETAETFDIDKTVEERFVEISSKAVEKNKRLKLPSPEMERIINRIKTSQLSYKRKELLLRQVWAKVRTESLNAAQGSANEEAQTNANSGTNRDFEESFYEMIRTFESVEEKKLSFNQLSKDMKKIDDLVDELMTEDEQFKAQEEAVSDIVNRVQEFENVSEQVASSEWNFEKILEIEN